MIKKYLNILGLTYESSFKDLKKNYRKLLKEYHPDILGKNTEFIKEVNEAYEFLSKHYEQNKNLIEKKQDEIFKENILPILTELKIYLKKYSYKLKMRNKIKISFSNINNYLNKKIDEFKLLKEKYPDKEILIYIIDLLNGIVIYNTMPKYIEVKTIDDRKAQKMYNEFYNNTGRIFEEVFSRIDGIKKKTNLWNYYLGENIKIIKDIKQYNIDWLNYYIDNFINKLLLSLQPVLSFFNSFSYIIDYDKYYKIIHEK